MYYSSVAVVATFLGQTVVLTAIRRSGRSSIIVMCIAMVLIVSLVMMTYLGVVRPRVLTVESEPRWESRVTLPWTG